MLTFLLIQVKILDIYAPHTTFLSSLSMAFHHGWPQSNHILYVPTYLHILFSYTHPHSHLQGLMKTYLWEPGVHPNEEYSTPEEQAHVSTTLRTPSVSLCMGYSCSEEHKNTPD